MFLKIFFWQCFVAFIVVCVLKVILDRNLIDVALRQFDFLAARKGPGQVKKVNVLSHKVLSPKNKLKVTSISARHLGPNVELVFLTDKAILGGIVIYLDEEKINFSLKDRLREAP
jgi:F0F1-type ATP synthase delta subunit